LTIPVFGSGDCVEPDQIVDRLQTAVPGISGVFVGRGVLRNPWILAQAQDLLAGRSARIVTDEARGQFLLDYIELLLHERLREEDGFRHYAPGAPNAPGAPRHDRWVINKVRALCSWYTKGFTNGAQLRIRVNAAESLDELRGLVREFFLRSAAPLCS
jgi:tRNA-dihydrouridine synthase